MTATIETRIEAKRGCGYRQPGGAYLVSDGIGRACGKMPIPLLVCPTCDGGFHQTRSYIWINSDPLMEGLVCSAGGSACGGCPLSKPLGRCGLMWVGKKFYKTPADFKREAGDMGVSKRLSRNNIPKGLVLGTTWILVAHPEAIESPDGTMSPGVFYAFQPTRVEYVVRGDETDEELERLVDRGITLVRVIPADEAGQPNLLDGDEEE